LSKVQADLHTHTVASGHAFSTFLENAEQAARIGLTLMGVTDHGPALPGGAHPFHFWNLRVLPRVIDGVRILRSVEANIMNADGDIDLKEEFMDAVDIVQAGMHGPCGYKGGNKTENTDVYIRVMDNPRVRVLVHPNTVQFPVDCETLVAAADDKGVLIELNNASMLTAREGSVPYLEEMVAALSRADSDILLASDAHLATDVGRVEEVRRMVFAKGIESTKILNFDADRLLEKLGVKAEVFIGS